eukprot:scaffold45569_cov221-Amphora_coffeaeformis.AAC.1
MSNLPRALQWRRGDEALLLGSCREISSCVSESRAGRIRRPVETTGTRRNRSPVAATGARTLT